MNELLLRWLTLTLAVIVTAYLLDGIRISGFLSARYYLIISDQAAKR